MTIKTNNDYSNNVLPKVILDYIFNMRLSHYFPNPKIA